MIRRLCKHSSPPVTYETAEDIDTDTRENKQAGSESYHAKFSQPRMPHAKTTLVSHLRYIISYRNLASHECRMQKQL